MKLLITCILFITPHFLSFTEECFQSINKHLVRSASKESHYHLHPQLHFIVKRIDKYIQKIEGLQDNFSDTSFTDIYLIEQNSEAILYLLNIKRRKYKIYLEIFHILNQVIVNFNILNDYIFHLDIQKKRTIKSNKFIKQLVAAYRLENTKLFLAFALPHLDILSKKIPSILKDNVKLFKRFIQKSKKNYEYLENYKVDLDSYDKKTWIFIKNFSIKTNLLEAQKQYAAGRYNHFIDLYTFLVSSKLNHKISLQGYFPQGITKEARTYLMNQISSNIQLFDNQDLVLPFPKQ